MSENNPINNWIENWYCTPSSTIKTKFSSNDFLNGKIKKLNFLSDNSISPFPNSTEVFWNFQSALDDEWALMNLVLMEELGLVVYISDDLGVFFTVFDDSYDLFSCFWSPLYKIRFSNLFNYDF